jgi:hypothetical protein
MSGSTPSGFWRYTASAAPPAISAEQMILGLQSMQSALQCATADAENLWAPNKLGRQGKFRGEWRR